ncbi:PilZ domain-containing protein [Halochromatium sp.]
MHQPAFNHCIVTDLPASLIFDNGQGLDGTAFNLSRSGVLMRAQKGCPKAKSGTLRLQTGDNRYLHLPVTVVHSGNRLVGLMLGALDKTSSAEIERLLNAKPVDDSSQPSGLKHPEWRETTTSLNP